MRVSFIVLMFLVSLSLTGQLELSGWVKEELDSTGIENVRIVHYYDGEDHDVVTTFKNGQFNIQLKNQRGSLIFHHPAFYDDTLSLSDLEGIEVVIYLKVNFVALEAANIYVNRPDTILGFDEFSISDFQFLPSGEFLLLTYRKRLEKDAQVRYVSSTGSVSDIWEVEERVKTIEKDFLGFTNLITEKGVFRLNIKENRIRIQELPKDAYYEQIKPVKDSIDEDLYFSNYRWDYPVFKYHFYDQETKEVTGLSEVKDPKTAEIFFGEYYYLNGKNKCIFWSSGKCNSLDS